MNWGWNLDLEIKPTNTDDIPLCKIPVGHSASLNDIYINDKQSSYTSRPNDQKTIGIHKRALLGLEGKREAEYWHSESRTRSREAR
jgi:hypothetical protein